MKRNQISSIAIASGIGLFVANSVFAQEAGPADSIKSINAATQQLAEGNVEEALQGYQNAADSAATSSGDNHTLSYNRGIAYYRQNNLEAAQQQFLKSLDSTDSSLAAKSWFNLGNCDYSTAMATAEQDRPAAIESLKSAISKYRRSLKLNSDDTDARANIELAAALINQLQQEEEQEQQQKEEQDQQQKEEQDQQPSGDQKSEPQNQSEQNQNRSQDQQNEDQKNKDQQSQGQSGDDQQQEQQTSDNKSEDQKAGTKSSDQAEQNENSSDQDQLGDQSDQGNQTEKQKQRDQVGEDKPEPNANDQPQADNKEKRDQDQSGSSESDDQSEEQQNPQSQQSAEKQQQDLQKQAQQLQQQQAGEGEPQSDEANDNQSKQGGSSMAQAGEPSQNNEQGGAFTPGYGSSHSGSADGEMDKHEAMKMLQSIRDRDLLRRYQNLRETQRRHIPVERDW